MSLAQLAALLQGITGFSGKVAYYSFPESAAPQLPFIVYLEQSSANMAADDKVYAKRKNIDIELYTAHKQPDIEARLENALDGANIVWTCVEDYIESERCYMRTYSIAI